MASELFLAAHPFQDDVLTLPVTNLDTAADFYAGFGLKEVERHLDPAALIMERDGIRIGFAVNGEDPEQDGAAIRVSDIGRARSELSAAGISVGEGRVDERDGEKFEVFFVVAPDGLCYYFHQAITD